MKWIKIEKLSFGKMSFENMSGCDNVSWENMSFEKKSYWEFIVGKLSVEKLSFEKLSEPPHVWVFFQSISLICVCFCLLPWTQYCFPSVSLSFSLRLCVWFCVFVCVCVCVSVCVGWCVSVCVCVCMCVWMGVFLCIFVCLYISVCGLCVVCVSFSFCVSWDDVCFQCESYFSAKGRNISAYIMMMRRCLYGYVRKMRPCVHVCMPRKLRTAFNFFSRNFHSMAPHTRSMCKKVPLSKEFSKNYPINYHYFTGLQATWDRSDRSRPQKLLNYYPNRRHKIALNAIILVHLPVENGGKCKSQYIFLATLFEGLNSSCF